MTALARDVEKLMDKSYEGQLAPQESKALLDYLKFVADLRALEAADKAEKAEAAAKVVKP